MSNESCMPQWCVLLEMRLGQHFTLTHDNGSHWHLGPGAGVEHGDVVHHTREGTGLKNSKQKP